ncbi:MAG: RluA family pseudouridine synthase [Kistimonas sp.]|nr:RluA family pseudouridine synthase [Kistimonas sp.]
MSDTGEPDTMAGQVSESVRVLSVHEELAGQRLDNFLLAAVKGVPRSWVYRVIRTGQVRVNRGRARAGTRIQGGDLVRVPPVRLPVKGQPAAPGERLVQQLENAIIFEDDALLVLNKPAGLAVHGGSGVSVGVIEILRHTRAEIPCLELVHRLDRDTSGCLLVAKKRSMLRHLHACMRNRDMTKVYYALVEGRWPSCRTKVSAPLQKNVLLSGERVVRVSADGKPSLTFFRVLGAYADASLLEVRLDTGRTHQIRVHSQCAGHPVLGDLKYGRRCARELERKLNLERLFLHASRLGFHLPDGHWREFEAPLPSSLSSVLDVLDAGSLEGAGQRRVPGLKAAGKTVNTNNEIKVRDVN